MKLNWYKIIELFFIFIALLIGILNWVKTQQNWEKTQEIEKKNNELTNTLNRPNVEIMSVGFQSCNFVKGKLSLGQIKIQLRPTFYAVIKNNSNIKISFLGMAYMDTITDKYVLRDRFLRNLPKEVDTGNTELPKKWINPGAIDSIPFSLILSNMVQDTSGDITGYLHFMMLYGTEFVPVFDIYFIQKITVTKEMLENFVELNIDPPKPTKSDDKYYYFEKPVKTGIIIIEKNRTDDHKIYNEEETEIVKSRIKSFSTLK